MKCQFPSILGIPGTLNKEFGLPMQNSSVLHKGAIAEMILVYDFNAMEYLHEGFQIL